MNILLVTLYGDNFGNRLQHYALVKTLTDLGNYVDTYVRFVRRQNYWVRTVKHTIKWILKETGIKQYNDVSTFIEVRKRWSHYNKQREMLFEKFNKNYIGNTTFLNSFKDILNIDISKYDFGITGSDQVWHNWHIQEYELEFFYLLFMPETKRISYAASFGFEQFPPKDLEIHKKGLKELADISCREKGGCDLIQELVNRKAVNVLDPTLLVKAEEWISLEEKPKYLIEGKKYLLVYFLGKFDSYKSMIHHYAKKNDLEIINILSLKDRKFFPTGPCEFIYLLHHAEFVCTDSFHATVFSIIFHRQFRCFPRKEEGMENMFGRIIDLCNKLNMNEGIAGLENNNLNQFIDFKNTDEMLQNYRRESLEFIGRAIV